MAFFFGRHEGKLEAFAKICVTASLETLRKDPRTAKVRDNRLFRNYSAKSLELPPGHMFTECGQSLFSYADWCNNHSFCAMKIGIYCSKLMPQGTFLAIGPFQI